MEHCCKMELYPEGFKMFEKQLELRNTWESVFGKIRNNKYWGERYKYYVSFLGESISRFARNSFP